MKKANILIEALVSLSLVVVAVFFLSRIYPETQDLIETRNPFNYLNNNCDITCALKKALP